VMIEAMACGAPVIGFPCGSVPEVIDSGATGLVVEDVDSAVRAVREVTHYDRRGVRRRFDERFTVERMAQAYIDVYHRLPGFGLSDGTHDLHLGSMLDRNRTA
jgi:glycosyltransferase involved in cell wall biosynthesis